jgi:hypothetical protein
MFNISNYKSKGTSYNSAFGKLKLKINIIIYIIIFILYLFILILEYDKYKNKETLEHDFGNHFKKSFMKTYEEDRIKHGIIIRK